MSAPVDETLAEIAGLLRRQTDEIAGLRADLKGARRARPEKLLISYREAARRLGVDRTVTLPALVTRGDLRPVDVNGRKRLRTAEVEQLAREGLDKDGPKRLPKRSIAQMAKSVRALRY